MTVIAITHREALLLEALGPLEMARLIASLIDDLAWIAAFASVRSKDDSKTFARVNRGALRTITERADTAIARNAADLDAQAMAARSDATGTGAAEGQQPGPSGCAQSAGRCAQTPGGYMTQAAMTDDELRAKPAGEVVDDATLRYCERQWADERAVMLSKIEMLKSALGFDPDGPCGICGGVEGCSHSLAERCRARPTTTESDGLRESQIETVQSVLGWHYEGPESHDRNVAERILAALAQTPDRDAIEAGEPFKETPDAE